MKLKIILYLVPILLISMGFFRVAQAATIDSEEQNFIDLINAYRAENGLIELKATKPLQEGAEYFAEFFSINPDDADALIHKDSRYGGPEERGKHFGFYFLTENVGYGQETAQEIFDDWKASSGHNANMLATGARTIGIARYYRPGQTKLNADGVRAACEYFWVLDTSDEGVERLIGDTLNPSEFYSNDYKRINVKVKKKNSKGKYKKAKGALVKVYDRDSGRLLDWDLVGKKGYASLYTFLDPGNISIKVYKNKWSSKVKKTKKINWSKKKHTVNVKI